MKLILTIETENMDELFNILGTTKKAQFTSVVEDKKSAPVVESVKSEPEAEVTLAELQEAATEAVAAREINKAAIRTILFKRGVKKLTELNEAAYEDVYDAIKALPQ